MRRGEQFEGHRHAPADEAGRLGQPEHLLQAHGHDRRALIEIVDANLRAARHGEVRRGERIELAQALPSHPGTQRLGERHARQVLAAGHALEPGGQPVLERFGERRVREVGPLGVRPAEAAHQRDPRLQLAHLTLPGQHADAQIAHAREQCLEGSLGRHRRERVRLEQHLIEAQLASRHHGLLAPVPLNRLAPLERPGDHRLECLALERRGEQDARITLAVIQMHRDDERLAGEALRLGEVCAATVGERESPLTAGAQHTDAVRKGEREQHPGGPCVRAGLPRPAELSDELSRLRPNRRQRGPVRLPERRLTAQDFQARAQIGVPAATAHQIAFGQQRRQICRERHGAELAGAEQHMRKSRMHGEARHRSAVLGDTPERIERAEPREQIAGALQQPRRRRIEPGQGGRIARPPLGKLERERSKVRLQDLRRREWRERAVGRLAPEPIAHAGLESSGTALTLLGGCPRDPLELEAAHPRVGIEAQAAHQPGINHHPHPLERQTGLGDVGGEHDATDAGERCERRILRRGGQLPVQRQDARLGTVALQQLRHTADLPRPGQEHQHITVRFPECAQHQASDALFGARRAAGERLRQRWRTRTRVARLHRE